MGLRIHPGKTKILSNQSLNIRKEIEIEDTKVEKLTREESTTYLGHMITPASGDDRNQNSHQGCLGTIPRVQTRADIEILHAQTSTSVIQRCGIPDDELRLWNLDTHERARKNDSINATQNASTHHINDKEIQKIGKRKDETNENDDTEDLCSTENENEDGQSSNTHNDHDSDISFENDADEEIHTTVIK